MPIEAALCGAVMLTARCSGGEETRDFRAACVFNFSAEQAAIAPMRRLWSATNASTMATEAGWCVSVCGCDFF